MSRARWSTGALQDLVEIGQYIGRDDPAAARRWLRLLRERAHAAAAVPWTGRKVPEFDREDIREVLVRTYRIIYKPGEGGIVVLTVLEGHRLLHPDMLAEEA